MPTTELSSESRPLLSASSKTPWREWIRPIASRVTLAATLWVGGTILVRSYPELHRDGKATDGLEVQTALGQFGALASMGTQAVQSTEEGPGTLDLKYCDMYDDDWVYPMHRPSMWYQKSRFYSSTCTKDDYLSYCISRPPWEDHDEKSLAQHYGVRAASLCQGACKDEFSSFFMPCLWEAVAMLPAVCNGTFSPWTPLANDKHTSTVGDSHLIAEVAASIKATSVELYPCDEHAACAACAPSNVYCTAVAEHYGTLRDPELKALNAKRRSGASVALNVLGDDFEYWCGRVRSIERGADYDADAMLAMSLNNPE